jgi:hypothetical protein
MKTSWRAAIVAAGSLLLSACGSGGGGDDDDGGTTPAAPTVTLTASPTSVVLGASSTLSWSSTDASACTASGSWTGARSASGTETVTPVAVGDAVYKLSCMGAGGSTEKQATVTVTAPVATGSITGKVVDTRTGAQIEGASVRVGSANTTTNAEGNFTLSGVPVGERALLEVGKAGYETNQRIVPVARDAESFASVVLLPVGASQTLDPAAGGDVGIAGSPAQVSFPAGAIDATGSVRVTITDVNPSASPDNMPGDFTTAGSPIESFGALSVNLYKEDGSATNLKSGQTATIRIPLDTRSDDVPAEIPLFFYDTAAGRWVEEGKATLGSDGRYYEGTVTHFTYWNADQVYNTVTLTGCVQDASGNRIAGVRLQANGIDYTGTSTATSGADGNFSIPVRSNANLTIGGYIGLRPTSTQAVQTQEINLTLPTCLQLGTDSGTGFTVTLTWGQEPSDLDSWLLLPEGGSEEDDHISYDNDGSLTEPPYANLDVDDTGSFGPEVITVLRPRVGTYRYFVNNYSQRPSPGISTSPARVELNANGVRQVFPPPNGETASTYNWTVFDIAIAADCTATVTRPEAPWSNTRPTLPQPANPDAAFCSR